MAKRKTVAAALVDLAQELYEVVVDTTGTPYAVPRQGARIALPLAGRGGALSQQLFLRYFERRGTPPNPTAVQSALSVLAAAAATRPQVAVHLRSARTETGLVVDLGDEEGRAIVVEPGRWSVAKAPPEDVVFRRTRLTAPLPRPSRRGNLDALGDALHLREEAWDLVRAWLVMAWMPHVPVPILSITGPQGAGKSVLARAVVDLLDPGPGALRSAPREQAEWQTVAAASRVVALDNLSSIPEWMSDAMCRTVTGEGSAKRMLYTDDELVVYGYRRALLLTSIDPGALRGDLAERLMPVELGRMRNRRSEETLAAELARRRPRVLGGLLDLIAQTLAEPVTPSTLPRMADAARIMAAVDAARGSGALRAYAASQRRIEQIVLEGDPVAAAVLGFARTFDREWIGTPTQLRDAALAQMGGDQRNWPANPRAFSQRLRRLEPALRTAHGLTVSWPRGSTRRVRLRWLRANNVRALCPRARVS